MDIKCSWTFSAYKPTVPCTDVKISACKTDLLTYSHYMHIMNAMEVPKPSVRWMRNIPFLLQTKEEETAKVHL